MLPTDAKDRKETPIASGVLDYFPLAIAEIARVSYIGNEQHNPGTALHWDRSKSKDEADALIRHFMERGTFDTDGARHSGKMAWRALALLEKELEAGQQAAAVAPAEDNPALRKTMTTIAPWEEVNIVAEYERCTAVSPSGEPCSLKRGHRTPHICYRGHSLGDEIVCQWGEAR